MDKFEPFWKIVDTCRSLLQNISEAIVSLDEKGIYAKRI